MISNRYDFTANVVSVFCRCYFFVFFFLGFFFCLLRHLTCICFYHSVVWMSLQSITLFIEWHCISSACFCCHTEFYKIRFMPCRVVIVRDKFYRCNCTDGEQQQQYQKTTELDKMNWLFSRTLCYLSMHNFARFVFRKNLNIKKDEVIKIQ